MMGMFSVWSETYKSIRYVSIIRGIHFVIAIIGLDRINYSMSFLLENKLYRYEMFSCLIMN